MTPSKLIYLVLVLVAALYPLLVYVGISTYGPQVMALVLLFVLTLRLVMFRKKANKAHLILFVLAAALCVVAIVFNSENMLKLYPVLMSLGFALIFLLSLKSEHSLIERFASLRESNFKPHQISYMRTLTKAWATLLFANAYIATYTAYCMSTQAWAFYNGFLAYVVFAVFGGFELLFRQFYKKKFEQQDA